MLRVPVDQLVIFGAVSRASAARAKPHRAVSARRARELDARTPECPVKGEPQKNFKTAPREVSRAAEESASRLVPPHRPASCRGSFARGRLRHYRERSRSSFEFPADGRAEIRIEMKRALSKKSVL